MLKKFLVFLLSFGLLFSGVPSYAAYAQLKPPPGWSQGLNAAVPGQIGTFAFGPAANYSSFKGSTVLTNAALNVAGQYVVVPVSMRLAANAATVAAEYSFGNPLLFAGILAGTAYLHYKQQGFELLNGKWVKKVYSIDCPNGTCYEFSYDGITWGTFSSACSAGQAARVPTNPDYSITWSGPVAPNTCAGTLYRTASDGQKMDEGPADFGVQTRPTGETASEYVRPVDKPEFVEKMKTLPLPVDFPKAIPDAPLPYEKPVINPNPSNIPTTNPTPSTPAARPIWVPTGDPVPASPATSPQTWTQPGKNVVSSPTTTDPWRVDVSDLPITKPSATPNTGPVTTPEPSVTPEITFETCGLPGKPACLIDESGTPLDKAQTFEFPTTEIDLAKDSAKNAIDAAENIQAPSWSFTFQFPSSCSPINTGLRGVVIDVCQFQPIIHDLLSMVWVGAAAFCIIGMVGRTIREA
jgi:hypothetical protein